MTAFRRGLVVLAASMLLGAVLWFVADTLGAPTPTETEPGVHQPALVGAQRTVTYLGIGTVLWLGWVLLTRLVRVARRRG